MKPRTGYRAERYRFNRLGDVVLDDRTDTRRSSSPGRSRFKQARLVKRANARGAAARAIHAAAQKIANAVIPDNDMRGDQ